MYHIRGSPLYSICMTYFMEFTWESICVCTFIYNYDCKYTARLLFTSFPFLPAIPSPTPRPFSSIVYPTIGQLCLGLRVCLSVCVWHESVWPYNAICTCNNATMFGIQSFPVLQAWRVWMRVNLHLAHGMLFTTSLFVYLSTGVSIPPSSSAAT